MSHGVEKYFPRRWGTGISDAILCFCLISILFLLSEIYNVLRGIGKPYVMSLDIWPDLPPPPTHPSPMGRIAVIK